MPRKTRFKIDLGNKIKNLRIKNSLTQEELGMKIGVKKTTITNYESGYSEPESEKIRQLALIFNVSTDFLLGNTTITKPTETLSNRLSSLHLTEDEFNCDTTHKKKGEIRMGNVPIKRAAELMNKSQQFIRISLQRGTLPIGNAEKMPGKTKFNYYISPKLLSDYTGIPIKQIKESEQNEIKNSK